MSAQGVFTRMKRVTFVDGQETATPDPGFVACGPGTAYPAVATLDQIAEIYYRVKDVKFSGGMSWTYDDGGYGIPMTFSAPASMPTNRTVEDGSPSRIQTRGYSVLGAEAYNDAIYDAGYGGYYSDIGDREVGMRRPAWNDGGHVIGGCITAFSYLSQNNTPPDSTWWGYAEAGNSVISKTGVTVAVVKTNPTNGFFDPTNKFFIAFEFSWFDYGFPVNFGGWTNIYDGVDGDVSATVSPAGNYTLRLQTGDILIPIYQANIDSYGHGCNVIHEATEWWPYAGPAGPVWESTTGAKL